jgi:hypothetical protein
MKKTLLALATILALNSAAFAQCGYYGQVPCGPPAHVWPRDARPWNPERFGPVYRTDPGLCINRNECRDPRRGFPVFPPVGPYGPPGVPGPDYW